MAKKKNEQNLKNDSPEVADVKKTDVSVGETHTGLMATVIAVAALLVIGGSIGAFVLFLKAKQNYLDPLIKSKTASDISATGGIGNGTQGQALDMSQDSASSGLDTITGANPLTANTTPQAPVYILPPPTTPADTTPVTSNDNQPAPEKVGNYDFDAAMAITDNYINSTSDDSMNPDVIKDSYFGF